MGRKSSSNVAVFVRLFLIVAMAMVCVLTFCSCDTKDVESLFQPSDFTVTFVLNNGEENVIWRKGDAVPTPQKKDFEFLYWCSDADLTAKTNLDFEKLNLVNSITVYAKWKELDDIQGVVFNDFSCVYDTKPHSIIVENLPEGAVVSYDVQNVQVAAGVYPVTATIKKEGCKDLVLSATLTINKAKVENILFPPVAVDWDGQAYGAFIKGELPEEVSVSYTGNGQSEVGEYDIVAKFTVSDNYEPIADMTTKLVINEVYFFVTFDDGVSTPIVRKVAHGKAVADMPLPTAKVGYSAKWEKESVENVLENLTVHAIYTPVVYTVSFVSDGETVSEKTYDIESSLTFEDISKPHYTFGGWFDNQNCFGNATTKMAVGNVGDKTYYAKWVAVEYYVTYHLNGGNNSELNTNDNGKYKYTIESDEFEFKAPSRKNYTFDGWYADADFEGESVSALKKGAHGNFDLYAKWIVEKFAITYELGGWFNEDEKKISVVASGSTGNITLTAKWSAIEYKITFDANGGSVVQDIIYTVETASFDLPTSSKANYEFAGWYDGEEQISRIEKGSFGNLSLVARWSAVGYKVKFESNGGSEIQDKNYNADMTDFELPVPTREYYDFAGWYANSDLSGDRVVDFSTDKDVTLYAKWIAKEYTIKFDSNGGESVKSHIYSVESADFTLPSIRKEYYDFIGWFDENGKKYEVISSKNPQDATLYARWKATEYTIVYILDGGENAENPTIYTVESDEIVLNEPTKDGYTFDGWFVDESKIERIVKGSHGDLILTARWTENIVVPLSDFAVENGVVTAYNGSATSITIKATEGGEKVVSIAKNTFDDVRTTVTEICIEEGIQSVEVGAFDGMTALQTLVLPSTITIMHKGMLQDCAALVNLTIPFASFAVDNKEDTQARTFTDSNDGKYAYGIAYLFGTPDDSVRDKFGDYTPYYMNFESGNTVMDNNTICIPISLTNLTVLGGNIIKKCFASMLNLQSVIIKGQSSIGQQAFSKCSSLKEVGIENENSTFGSAVFAGCSDMTIYVASDEQKSTLDGQISALTNVTCTVA